MRVKGFQALAYDGGNNWTTIKEVFDTFDEAVDALEEYF